MSNSTDEIKPKKPTSLDDIKKAMSDVDEEPMEETEETSEVIVDTPDTEVVDEDESATENIDEDEPKEETEVESSESEEEPKYATPNALNQRMDDEMDMSTPAQSLISLESMINRYVGDIEKMKEQLKTQKDMFNDAVQNDAEYAKEETKAKEINRAKNAAKQKITKQPAVASIVERMNTMKDEIKEMQEALSNYLQQFQKIAGTNQLVAENGEIREIVTTHRLIKKGKGRP